MGTGFLNICGAVTTSTGRETVGSAGIDISRYADKQPASSSFLLLEGMNQFAVRLGRRALGIPPEARRRVLPVSIRSCELLIPWEENTCRITGEATQFGRAAMVSMRALSGMPGGFESTVFASAEITVASPEVLGAPAAMGAEIPPVLSAGATSMVQCGQGFETMLFSAQSRIEREIDARPQSVDFRTKERAPLFEDHFPGSPIVPASLLLEFVWTLCRDKVKSGSNSGFCARNVRLMKPLTPGKSYRVEIVQLNSIHQIMFTVRDWSDSVLARGSLA